MSHFIPGPAGPSRWTSYGDRALGLRCDMPHLITLIAILFDDRAFGLYWGLSPLIILVEVLIWRHGIYAP